MIDWLSLGLVVLAALLLGIASRARRRTAAGTRPIAALNRLYRSFGLSVEDGTRLVVHLGAGSLITRNAGPALAGLDFLRGVSQKASVSDRPPVAVAGDAALALLAQDTLYAGYDAAGAGEYYQAVMGRVAGLTAFSAAAATMQVIGDEQVSVAALIGQFGAEAGLLADAADRASTFLVGGTGDANGQSVLFAAAPEVLIGEELFAAPAYSSSGPMSARLIVHDILRWVTIGGLLAGALLRFLGLL